MRTVISILSIFFLPLMLKSQAVVIDFESLQTTPVTVLHQYANQGVTFNGPLGRDYSSINGMAHSGTKALELCFGIEFCTAPLTIDFTTGQSRAKLWVGYSSQLPENRTVMLRAYDGNGNDIGGQNVTLPVSTNPIPVQHPLEVSSQNGSIRKLVLTFFGTGGLQAYNNGLVIDDLEFSSAGPTPNCNSWAGPTINLLQPNHYGYPDYLVTTVQVNEFMLQGNVITQAPLIEATLRVVGTTGTRQFDLLNGIMSTLSGSFGPTRISGALTPGLNKIYVYIKHCGWDRTDSGRVIFEPIPSGTGFKLLHIETTQAIQDINNSVPLIANKPTIARVYVSLTGAASPISNVSASLIAKRPGGTYLVPLINSLNSITLNSSTDVSAKREDLNASFNFLLPQDWTLEDTVHFQLSKLYLNGLELILPCEGCDNMFAPFQPRYARFHPTKQLNLVLAPYVFPGPQNVTLTPDLIFTPMISLQWLNNVFPIAGNYPYDPSGINILRYLPMRSTSLNLATDGGTSDFLDELEDLRDCLEEQNENTWPSDFRVFGVVAVGGGRASTSRKIGFGGTWAVENGFVPSTTFQRYGTIWAHEIAHTFGRYHAGSSHGEALVDANFPYPHGSLNEYGLTISTEHWSGTPRVIVPGSTSAGERHSHDLMSYGDLGSPHIDMWVSPYTYKALFNTFKAPSQMAAARVNNSENKMVIKGKLLENGTLSVRPIYQVNTKMKRNDGTNGKYSIELLGDNGRTLMTHRFDLQKDNDMNHYIFSEYVTMKPGTRLITIKQKGKTLYSKQVSLNKPWVRITNESKNQVWEKTEKISWEAGDADKDSLTFTVFYNTGKDSLWLPIATGVKDYSTTVNTSLLPGSSNSRIKVRVTDGVNTSEAISEKTYNVADKKPVVTILSHTDGKVISSDGKAQFIGAAYDPEDGMILGNRLVWKSDRDGIINLEKEQRLSRGKHRITLTATDSKGQSTSTTISMIVGLEELRIDKK